MLICMRTTVILPDELMRQVKQDAHERQLTLTAFFERAVRRELAEVRAQQASRVELPASGGAGGLKPGVDINNGAALQSLLDEELPFEKLR